MQALSGLRLRYLIGANEDDGQDGAFTVVGFDATQKPTKGIGGKYCNLFDEKNTGTYGPYLTSSDTAGEYKEGQCDPAQAGFWRNVGDQIRLAKAQGFTIVEWDNRDAYKHDVVKGVYDLAYAAELSVVCKNPGMSDSGEDSTELLKHPAVIGCIIEQGDVTAHQIVLMRAAAGKPELPVWFVSFGNGKTWAEKIVAEIAADSYVNMSVTYSSVGEYESSETIGVQPAARAETGSNDNGAGSPAAGGVPDIHGERPDVHAADTDLPVLSSVLQAPAGSVSMTFSHGQRIKQVMQARGYPWFADQNVVSIETMNTDGSLCLTGPNTFDDIKMVLDGDGNIIGGPWEATTHPGTYWTQHPMASGGAFIIALGSQACWTPGEYHNNEVWRQAEDSTIMGHRDPSDTYKRQGEPVKHGNIGVHHHGGYNLPKGNISNAAAGCQVVRSTADQAAFMHLTKQCPRYLADPKGYRLTATVLEAKDVLGDSPTKLAETPPVPEQPVVSPSAPSANQDFAHCLALVLVHEGGNDDDPRDPGGRTSRGILQREWDVWRVSHPGLPSDVWQAPQGEIAAIYKSQYWDLMLCDGLPSGIDYAVFDYGVNSGPSRSAKTLQGALGLPADGKIGKNTIAAAVSSDAKAVINKVCDQRLAFLQGLSTWGTFGHGWSTRVSDVRRDALALVGSSIPAPIPIPAPLPPPLPPIPPVPSPKPKEPPVVTEPLPLPPPTPSPQQPTAALSDAQKAQLVDALSPVIAATVQRALQSPQAVSIFSSLTAKLFNAVPQLSVIAYVALNALQALGHVGTATGDTATAAGVIATSGILGAGVLGLLSKLGKLGGLLALIPKP